MHTMDGKKLYKIFEKKSLTTAYRFGTTYMTKLYKRHYSETLTSNPPDYIRRDKEKQS